MHWTDFMITEDWIKRHLEHYTHMRKVFYELFNQELYMTAGTLLGIVRENDIIKHDRDMDTAYLINENDHKLFNVINNLIKYGENISIVTEKGGRRTNYFWWYSKDKKCKVDVFPAILNNGFYIRPKRVNVELEANIILPLKKIMFYDVEIVTPNNSMKKVEVIFGDTWRTPIKKWRWQDHKPKDEIKLQEIKNMGLSPEEIEIIVKKSRGIK